MSDNKPLADNADDPRPVSDHKVREEHTQDEVQRWRDEANTQHQRWMDVIKNRYGKE
jgi:hypothetical protein